mmetsp:Transcript_3363/g.10325  ORF Transcript_3363/g.10325 Transcript_3363/m.10325 type:complete len:233 (-) Transcript_3363:328-1026(-)
MLGSEAQRRGSKSHYSSKPQSRPGSECLWCCSPPCARPRPREVQRSLPRAGKPPTRRRGRRPCARASTLPTARKPVAAAAPLQLQALRLTICPAHAVSPSPRESPVPAACWMSPGGCAAQGTARARSEGHLPQRRSWDPPPAASCVTRQPTCPEPALMTMPLGPLVGPPWLRAGAARPWHAGRWRAEGSGEWQTLARSSAATAAARAAVPNTRRQPPLRGRSPSHCWSGCHQ